MKPILFKEEFHCFLPICFGFLWFKYINEPGTIHLVHIYTDGSVAVSTGAAIEMGQGVNTKIARWLHIFFHSHQ